MTYFGTLSRDGTGDQDGDGASDLDEFRAGTNPINDSSTLRVLTLTTAAAGNDRTTVVLWSAVPTHTYRVQAKTAWEDAWSDVSDDIIATTESAQATHHVSDGLPRFYRVRLVGK